MRAERRRVQPLRPSKARRAKEDATLLSRREEELLVYRSAVAMTQSIVLARDGERKAEGSKMNENSSYLGHRFFFGVTEEKA